MTFMGSVLGTTFAIMLVGNTDGWMFFVVAALMPCVTGWPGLVHCWFREVVDVVPLSLKRSRMHARSATVPEGQPASIQAKLAGVLSNS
jgi:hypothetical protein